jgi:hypothetical protein
MQHITGISRNQMVFSREASGLEDTILPNNPVCFIDAFVEALSLVAVGFKIQTIKSERGSHDMKFFLKIYFHDYLNGLGSLIKIKKKQYFLLQKKRGSLAS